MADTVTILSAMESSVDFLVAAITQYGLVGYGVAVFLFGETAIVLGLLLLRQSEHPVLNILSMAAVGTMMADLFWFLVGRYFPRNAVPSKIRSKIFTPAYNTLATIIENRIFWSLVFLKFFVGVRLISVLYISKRPITFIQFVFYDLLGTILYLLALTLILFQLGQTVEAVVPAFHTLSSVLLGLLLLMVASILTRRYLFRPKRFPDSE